MVCSVSMHDYPEQQSGGVVCSHQAVDGLKKPPQRLLKLRLLFSLVQPGRARGKINGNATGKTEKKRERGEHATNVRKHDVISKVDGGEDRGAN